MEASKTDIQNRMRRYIKVTLIALGVVLVVLCVVLAVNYFSLRRANVINTRELSLSAFVQKHGPLTADETGVLRSWMTFAYINKLFALPPDFLKNTFGITDAHYPNITVSGYVGSRHLDAATFMISLETAIGDYLQSPPQPQPSQVPSAH
jgi:hypothetical protein